MATATTSKASTTDAYKNAKLVQDSVSKALSLKGKKYSDIVSKAPADSKVEELQWVDLVTAGLLLLCLVEIADYAKGELYSGCLLMDYDSLVLFISVGKEDAELHACTKV